MMGDLHDSLLDFRLITASAYPGLMAPLPAHPSAVCLLGGDADNTHEPIRPLPRPLDGSNSAGASAREAIRPVRQSLEGLDGVRRRWRFGDVARLADFVPKVLADSEPDRRPILLIPPRVSAAWEQAAASWPQAR